MIKFLQMYSDGKEDYTDERGEILKNLDKEDLQKIFERRVKLIR